MDLVPDLQNARNSVYMGHVAQGKTPRRPLKAGSRCKTPGRMDRRRENARALICRETFNAYKKDDPAAVRRNRFVNVFSGIAKCADCGRNMSTTGSRRKDGSPNLVCGGYKLYGGRACTNHFIDYGVLCDVVLREIRALIAIADADKQALLDDLDRTPPREKNPGETGAAAALSAQEAALDRIVAELYEDRAGGRLDEARFYRMLASCEARQRGITARRAALARAEPSGEAADGQDARREFLQTLDALAETTRLTPELLHKLIDRIEIFQGSFGEGRGGRKRQAVRIYYKFSGPA
jgi:hypothetical protein